VDRGGVVELKNPCVLSSCSVLTLCMSGYVGLDWPSLGGPSRVFLAVKEVGSWGWHVGLRAPEHLEATGKLCLLVSRPVCDLVGKVANNAIPKGQHRRASEPR
jgi:hypothetical protein